MQRLFTALVLLVLSTALHARDYDDWYEVEIILFEHVNPAAIDAERWPPSPGAVDMENTIELLTPALEERDLEESDDENSAPVTTTATTEAHSTEEHQTVDSDNGGSAQALPFELLPADTFQLTEHYQKLEQAEAYRPLLHLAWRQIIQGRHRPDRIHLFSGLGEAKAPATDPAADTEIDIAGHNAPPAMWDTSPDVTTESATDVAAPQQQWVLDEQGNVINIPLPGFSAEAPLAPEATALELDGVLTLSRGRYIHVETDFLWQIDPIMTEHALAEQHDNVMEEEVVTEEALNPLPQPFGSEESDVIEETALTDSAEEVPVVEAVRVQGKLRTRSTEIQYLDHPMVGMLILFTPYAPPLAEEEEESTGNVETFAIGR